jgi:hypothetical protein
MATGYALLKNRTDDSSVYQIPAASRRDRPSDRRASTAPVPWRSLITRPDRAARYLPVATGSSGSLETRDNPNGISQKQLSRQRCTQGCTQAKISTRVSNGRGDKIRTCDPLHPMQVRYQAAPRPDRGTE